MIKIFLLEEAVWYDLGISIGILLAFLILRKAITTSLFKIILTFTTNKKINVASTILTAFEKPVRWLFVILGLQLTLLYFPFEIMSSELERNVFRTMFIVIIGWGLLNLSSVTTLLFPKLMKKLDINIDKIVVPFVTKILKTIIVLLASSMIAEEWSFNVNGFIAGLGLGGLAFALAAKETVSNLFGGVVIVTEKPFTIGDWVKTPSVEGIIEDITFRSTKVRTFDQALVTVPNSTLANEPIINWSKMGKRQISFHLGVTYSTPKRKLERLVKEIESMLKNHHSVHNDTIIVNFDRFNDSSLDIFLYFFTTLTGYNDYLKIREDINFRILTILENEGVEIAFPTRTLLLQPDQVELSQEKEPFKVASNS
ncbi:mechanosensitive ion channel family protein [Cytobacillus sp. FJAT-54145]|uniref:Mechanosensitive ion channel family protein n=1 Tax=Cytobacillus spartinae TaxID=3299023 RepID=A0ABW6KCR8_9BACI